MKKENIILKRTFDFALMIIEYSELLENHRKFIISRQVLRSGTSIGANIREAQSAESKADFNHKLKIADKEIKETTYWLMLCKEASSIPSPCLNILNEIHEIEKIVAKIIITSKKN